MTFTELEREFHIDFEKRALPPNSEIMRRQAERVAGELIKEAREVELSMFLPLAEGLRETDGATEIIAYFLKSYFMKLEKQRANAPTPGDERRREDRRSRGQVDDEDKPKKRKKKKKREDEPKTPRARHESLTAVPDRIRLFVNRGSSDGYDDGKIRQLILGVSGVDDETSVFRVQLRRTHAFVEVKPETAAAAVKAAEQGVEREDKPVAIERARTRG